MDVALVVVTPKRVLLVALATASVRCLMYLLLRTKGARRSCKSVAAYAAKSKLRDEPYAELQRTLLSIIGKDTMRQHEGEKRSSLYITSAEALSTAMKSSKWTPDDLLKQNTDKLFWIHEKIPPGISGGMSVRVTVQLNLFAGSVANLGDDSQRALLQDILSKGELGCFALTEEGAGVLSGLIVDTTATFNPATGGFVLHSPTKGSRKWWISQGCTAKWAVVVARLFLPASTNASKSDFGPHAFLIDLAKAKSSPAALVADMAPKTDFNDLDNATIAFNQLEMSNAALLAGTSYVDAATGTYRLRDPAVPFRFEIVAQRLMSGRICIPLAAVSLVAAFETRLKSYDRMIPTGKDVLTPLSSLPVMRDAILKSARIRHVFSVYLESVKRDFIQSPPIFSSRLVEKVAVGKIMTVDFAIQQLTIFKGLVGSFALMADGPFGTAPDLLYVFQFAEGDSAILKQKIARDLLTQIAKSPAQLAILVWRAFSKPSGSLESKFANTALELVRTMRGARSDNKVELWLNAHVLINRLARIRCVMTVRETAIGEDPSLRGSQELADFDDFFRI